MTLGAQLDQLQKAIDAIETGAQEYRIADRLVRRADINVLYKERKDLRDQIAKYGFDYDPAVSSGQAFLRSRVID